MENLRSICFIGLVLCLLAACSSTETIEHIEVFVINTSEQNNAGFFGTTGYKKVNAITLIEDGKHHIKTDIKAIEDFYDINGAYLKTEIIQSKHQRSKVTLAEDGEDIKQELGQPSTILIPDDHLQDFRLDDLTDNEKEKVRKHVLSLIKDL
ncbi:hypothetical protein DS745_04075 [Anaerobacillus alkaliphilus]|uniref:DUF4825 domain-containing protein n=1 Tax=Anaerobacillus alkaliphilus TaxID=1548597 RepID=A0A4Q0VYP0_9BACI|nr:hypothetical protein [Anaerobacillus alkaliphilus]RXJ04570.1 hypothetical protein DS745_04075 [Anaerobacillus alkaliphilus]